MHPWKLVVSRMSASEFFRQVSGSMAWYCSWVRRSTWLGKQVMWGCEWYLRKNSKHGRGGHDTRDELKPQRWGEITTGYHWLKNPYKETRVWNDVEICKNIITSWIYPAASVYSRSAKFMLQTLHVSPFHPIPKGSMFNITGRHHLSTRHRISLVNDLLRVCYGLLIFVPNCRLPATV